MPVPAPPPRRARAAWGELDRTSWPGLREQIDAHGPGAAGPRAYPGYPSLPLPRVRARPWVGLEATLAARRSARRVAGEQPGVRALARLLRFAHGALGAEGRGPVPSAGGLQALELYLVTLGPGPLEPGPWHYDRAAHALSRLPGPGGREVWAPRVPSLHTVEGGGLLLLIVGDLARVEERYGGRALRFLLLEAGHLMQDLCLLSASLGLCTVPLGVALEPEVADALSLLPTDAVLYAGLCGRRLA